MRTHACTHTHAAIPHALRNPQISAFGIAADDEEGTGTGRGDEAGDFTQFGDTEIGGPGDWGGGGHPGGGDEEEVLLGRKKRRQSLTDESVSEEGEGKTIAQVLDELGINEAKKQTRREKREREKIDGHAPEIAREMGLSDPSEDNPDEKQVNYSTRYYTTALHY
jgi:hypothetical protein